MIHHDEVTWAYRMLLGREPESEVVLNHYATQLDSRQALRALFMQSAEFDEAVQQLPARSKPAALSGPAMAVQMDAAPDKLEALFDKISQQWHHLGDTEPHWSVLTSQSYLQNNIQDSARAFYASGVSELAVFDATLARVGLAGRHFATCVELGCGVGRVTAALAQRCDQVWGVDISASHLQLAAAHMAEQGLVNVHLHQAMGVDGVAPVPSFDLLYSRIVLQHNPPPVMHRMLSLLLQRLTPGGVAYFQVPTYHAGYRFSIDEYLAAENTTSMEMHYLPQHELFKLVAQCNCQVLEVREDDAIGSARHAVSNTLLLQKLG